MKKKIIILIILITLIIGILFIINFNKKQEFAIIVENEIEVYSKIKLSDIVIIKNGKLLNDEYIDTTKIGTKKVYFTYMNENSLTKKGILSIKVIDKEEPYIGIGKTYTHVIGKKFTLEEDTFCGDNVTVNPKCIIIGEYNLEKEGKYPLIFKATDESGNTKEAEFTLNVVEKRNNTTTSRITFEEIKKNVPKDAVLMIDVSKWQEDIDWEEVKNSGIEYAMLRLGTQKGIDQDSVIDSYFDENIKEAKEHGIKVGVYYFSYANDINDAKTQGKWVVDVLKNYEIELPVVFDWECWNFFNKFDINFYQLNMIAKSFLEEVEQAGYDVALYGSKNYIENVWKYLDYDIWLAHYTKETSYAKEKLMWQFTNVGEIPGIRGNVDVNYLYKKY